MVEAADAVVKMSRGAADGTSETDTWHDVADGLLARQTRFMDLDDAATRGETSDSEFDFEDAGARQRTTPSPSASQ